MPVQSHRHATPAARAFRLYLGVMALSWLRPPIRDDRGNAVELLLTRTEGRAEWPVSGDERIERLRERLERGLGRRTAVLLLPQLIALPLFLVPLAFVTALTGGNPGGAWALRIMWACAFVVITLVVGLGLLSRRFLSGNQARTLTHVLLDEGLCPGCGYNLVGLAPEPDHMVVCPECGGAWKQERIFRAAPFVEGARLGPALPRVSWSWTGSRAGRLDFDDRSKQVRLVSARPRRMRAAARSEAHRARLAAAAELMRRSGRGTRRKVAGFLAGSGVILGIVSAWVAWQGGLAVAGVFAAALGGPLLAFGIIAAVNLTLFGRDIIDAMKGEGLCASCGTMLDVMRPAEDGCVECPACGAAWRARG